MKKKIVVFLLLIYLIPIRVEGLQLSCRSCILMDMDSGRVLYEKDINTKRLIASTTKIMTAIIAIENGNLEEEITVGNEVLSMYGSNIYIEVGEKIKLIDLLYGLMLRSGNDAAIVIATHIGKNEEEFVKMMNDKAKKIGMKNTEYNNSHGLDEYTENKSTAYDMALLSKYANSNSTYRKIVETKKYTVKTNKKTYKWTNRNKLLFTYDYTTGGKTGYTPKAGRTLVTTASKDNMNLTAVALNDGNEYDTHKKLYEYGFNKYENYKILNKGSIRIDTAYFKDKVYIKKDFKYPLSEEEIDKIKVIVKINKKSGYDDGEKVGEITVELENKQIFKDNVYVKAPKHKKGIFNKISNLFK